MRYIGITGITQKSEIDALIPYLHKDYAIMVGILVSYKILEGENNNKVRYVKKENLTELCKYAKEKGFFTVIHYNSRNRMCHGEISKILKNHSIEDQIDGIQLNVNNPPLTLFSMLKMEYPSIKLIFSVNRSIITDNKNNILADADLEGKFMCLFKGLMSESIDYVLIDLSGGRGKTIDVIFASKLALMILQMNYKIEIGFAGGLSDENLIPILLNLETEIGQSDFFSIDAESKLRDESDQLDIKKLITYVKQASSYFIKK